MGILDPIAKTLMKKKQLPLLSREAYFYDVLFHELSHSLGPAFVGNDESNGDIRSALGAAYSGLEEAKADVMGIYNILFMIEKGIMPRDMENRVLFTYISGLFRSIRFGVSEAHGKGAALKLKESVKNLVRDICTWQHNGDKETVDSVMEKYGRLGDTVKKSLDKLTEVPLDIKPCYPLAGEDCSNVAN